MECTLPRYLAEPGRGPPRLCTVELRTVCCIRVSTRAYVQSPGQPATPQTPNRRNSNFHHLRDGEARQEGTRRIDKHHRYTAPGVFVSALKAPCQCRAWINVSGRQGGLRPRWTVHPREGLFPPYPL